MSGDQIRGVSVDVLLPTVDRPGALAVTLAGLAAQEHLTRVIVADQSATPSWDDPVVDGAVRVLRHRGVVVDLQFRPHRLGVAEQLHALLARARSPLVLVLGDDVLLEPGALARMVSAIRTLGAGFVGMAVTGLAHLHDERPEDWGAFEVWDGPVQPERVRKGVPSWDRWRLHNAATMVHLARRAAVPPGGWLAYKVAWVGGCALYDVDRLRAVGGFDFWPRLGRYGYGEDVVVQLRLLERWGGAGLLPSLAHHLQLPTTLPRRDVDGYATVLEADDPASTAGTFSRG